MFCIGRRKKIEVAGEFFISEKYFHAIGEVTFSFPHEQSEHHYKRVEFFKGMWTVDRMNFYLRSENGKVTAGLIVDNYFTAQPEENLRGSLYGKYGSRELTCQREAPYFYDPSQPSDEYCRQCKINPTWDCMTQCPIIGENLVR